MDRVQIPFDPQSFSAQWEPSRPSPAWVVDSDGMVYLRCACSNIIGSPTKHSIDEDGTVNASIWDREGCGWHVYGRLVDWTGGSQPAGSTKVLPR